MKAHILLFFIFASLLVKGQNTSCSSAIELTDSILISDCAIKELWFKFRQSERKYVINILSADSSAPIDYILYKGSSDFCQRVSTDSIIPVGVSFHYGPHEYEGLTLEQIAGNCCCNSCESRDRFLSLKKDSLYYIRIFPRGKSVLLKKDYRYPAVAAQSAFFDEVRVGKRMALQSIHFYPESSRFLESSEPELDRLYVFMMANPGVSVEIQGHVNAPGRKNEQQDKQLSQARANAVRSFLVKKGISSSRIRAKGYGNTRMLYPSPRNEQEMKMNRRVELEVTKVEP